MTGWVVGDDGIFKSIDGGVAWAKQVTDIAGLVLLGIDFVDASTGWAVGGIFDPPSLPGVILATTDGGSTWIKQDSRTSSDLLKVDFASPQVGWVVGFDANFYGTADGGDTWTPYDSGTSMPVFYDVTFVNETAGYIVGWGGNIFSTEDAGVTWNRQVMDPAVPLFDVFFADNMHGWVVPLDNTLFRTTDGGTSWEHLTPDLGDVGLSRTHFVNAQLGWGVGGDFTTIGTRNNLMQTLDGGKTWETKPFGPQVRTEAALTDIHIGQTRAWAIGMFGTLIATDVIEDD